MRSAVRHGRRVLAVAVVAGVMGAAMLFGSTAAWAEGGDSGKAEEISPEEYPAPPTDEKTVPPKPPVKEQPKLARTGVELPWFVFAITGIGLVVVGGGILLARRRLSHD
jgi:hypothetical protein